MKNTKNMLSNVNNFYYSKMYLFFGFVYRPFKYSLPEYSVQRYTGMQWYTGIQCTAVHYQVRNIDAANTIKIFNMGP